MAHSKVCPQRTWSSPYFSTSSVCSFQDVMKKRMFYVNRLEIVSHIMPLCELRCTICKRYSGTSPALSSISRSVTTTDGQQGSLLASLHFLCLIQLYEIIDLSLHCYFNLDKLGRALWLRNDADHCPVIVVTL